MKIGFIFIGTNNYITFFAGYYAALTKYFLPESKKHFFVFTDDPGNDVFDVSNHSITRFRIKHRKWPFITLNRFSYIHKVWEHIENQVDVLFFIDSDLWPCSLITEADILDHDKSLIAVRHPGYIEGGGPFEDNKLSTAYISLTETGFKSFNDDSSIYRQGCLWGGTPDKFFDLVETCCNNVQIDKKNKIIAKWHDESHTNKYFTLNNKDVYTLHPGYACPVNHDLTKIIEKQFEVKMIHLEKNMKEYPRFERG